MRNAIYIFILLLVAIIVSAVIGFYFAIRPIRIMSTLTPGYYGLQYESISYSSFDGAIMKGWFVPALKKKAKTIIILHGYPADKGNVLPITLFLHQKYNLLYLDFRYFGESGGNYSTIGAYEYKDVLAAIQYLKKNKQITPSGIWGFSLGGSVALLVAANNHDIKAIVADSPFARLDWMLDGYYSIPYVKHVQSWLTSQMAMLTIRINPDDVSPLDIVSKIKIPVLLIHSIYDPFISYQHAAAIYSALPNVSNKYLYIHESRQHGVLPSESRKVVLMFFNRYLQ